MSTTPNEIKEATKAAMAKAVPALSVSTTLRTATALPVAVLVAPGEAGFPETPGGIPTAGPALAAGEVPGSGGFAAGIATVAPAPGGLGPAPAGRGGSEILMVSLRKSPGALFPPIGAGADGEGTPPGTEGTPGTAGGVAGDRPGAAEIAGLGGLRRMVSFFTPGGGGTRGVGGLGAGASLTVSFFTPGTGGGTAGPGGLAVEIPGGIGGFGTAGKGGAEGGFGTPGGKGKPSAI